MKKTCLTIIALLLFNTPNSNAGTMTGTGTVETYRLPAASYAGSMDRDYKVYVPRSYDRTRPYPMVFALHGCNMDHDDAIDNWNWDLIADDHGVIVVFPFVTGYVESRNRNCWGYWFPAHIHEGAGEVEDLHRMAQAVESHYRIDPERRYIIGLSSGGGMAVAAAIAHNEYWAAGASAAGLAYGDGSDSVLWERFKTVHAHIQSIEAELDDPRTIPFLAIQSLKDETVRLQAAKLIRDSHMEVFSGNVETARTQDCSAEAIACTHTIYTNDADEAVVETVFYDGAVSGTQCGPLGCGHYYGGADDDARAWAYGTGPNTTRIAWQFFSRQTFSGNVGSKISIQTRIIAGNQIQISGSATDSDGNVAAVDGVLQKYSGTEFQDFVVLPATAGFDAFSLTSPTLEDGIYKVYAVAIDDEGAKSTSPHTIEFVNVSVHPPEITDVAASVDQHRVTIAGKVTDADNDLERVQVNVGDTEVSAEVSGDRFSSQWERLPPGNYSAAITAMDRFEQKETVSVDFQIEYVSPPSATSTLQKHCEAGRLPWSAYSSYYPRYGPREFTLYQQVDGTWSDQIPGAACVTAPISEHVQQGRAYAKTTNYFFFQTTHYYAVGSDHLLGRTPAFIVPLQETDEDFWIRIEECP